MSSLDADETIRLTDYDALSSRVSCYLKGYIPHDTFILHLVPLVLYYHLNSIDSEFKKFALTRKLKSQFFNFFSIPASNINQLLNVDEQFYFNKINRFTPLKSPMINRGTYLRTISISNKINDFLSSHTEQDIQIISLGAGNDTRVFNILPTFPNVTYFELDMDKTTRLKKLAILSSPLLSKQVGATNVETLPTNSLEINSFDPSLHTERYHLIPIDLRSLNESVDPGNIPHFTFIDNSKPTLIISECCICYLQKDESNSLIKFWHQWIQHGQFLVYEPLGGTQDNNSKYGEVMIKNLLGRGIHMDTLMTYGSVEAQQERFDNLVSSNTWCKSMKWVYENEIEQSEKDRISKLEMLDELEELNLINSHYCLIISKF
ncbi:hypothetical protein CANINC_000778 [Pichia inconspicua]|uniref:Leucine carboxyl methyltransferase 1 n=1 Tax=Pichia inconspicua TaxID=52247 RepID=A0A4T0X5Q7_9ASCO|nr:hypothetical protein CANINC_000778 [[Candida] inconspicua]